MTVGCYCLRVSGTPVFYIGSSVNVEKRLDTHEYELSRGIHANANLQATMAANPDAKLTIYTVPTETLEEAREIEDANIRAHAKDPNFANIGLGVFDGDNLSRNPNKADIVSRMTDSIRKRVANYSDEERQKLSTRNSGSNNPMYGKTHTEEARAKISEAHTGHTRGRGIALSPEHVAKISERQKLRVGPLNSFYGKTHSPEYKQWASESRVGVPNLSCSNEIEIDGVRYQSQSAAAKVLGVCAATITHRIGSKNPKFANYSVVKKQEES